MHDDRFYRHSGRFSVAGLFIGFVVTAVIGSALAVVYAFALRYIPFVYINILLVLGFGFVLGLVATRFVSQFKIRNARLAYLMTFLAVLVSYYFAWAAWMAAHLRGGELNVSMLALARHPGAMWELMKVFNEHGTWSLGWHSSTPVSGLLLTLVWIAEAVMIFGAALLTMGARLLTPFCEGCETWCQEQKAVAAVGASTIDVLPQRVLKKEWAALEEAGPREPHVRSWCTVDLYVCPSCGQTNTLTLSSVTMTADKKGETKTQTEALINRLLLTADETQALRVVCERLNASPTVPEAHAVVPETDKASDSGPESNG